MFVVQRPPMRPCAAVFSACQHAQCARGPAFAILPPQWRINLDVGRELRELPDQAVERRVPPPRRRAARHVSPARIDCALLVEQAHLQAGHYRPVEAPRRILRRLHREQRMLTVNDVLPPAHARRAPFVAVDHVHAQRMIAAAPGLHQRLAEGRWRKTSNQCGARFSLPSRARFMAMNPSSRFGGRASRELSNTGAGPGP